MVGIDGSSAAWAALRWAAQHVERNRAPIQAVAVWHPPPQFGDATVTTEADFEQEAQGWLHDALTDLPRVEVSTVVEHGDPSRVLLDYAVQAEVLVLGNHARGAWSEALLGSVAQQCVRQARCPVVLVPDPTHGQDH